LLVGWRKGKTGKKPESNEKAKNADWFKFTSSGNRDHTQDMAAYYSQRGQLFVQHGKVILAKHNNKIQQSNQRRREQRQAPEVLITMPEDQIRCLVSAYKYFKAAFYRDRSNTDYREQYVAALKALRFSSYDPWFSLSQVETFTQHTTDLPTMSNDRSDEIREFRRDYRDAKLVLIEDGHQALSNDLENGCPQALSLPSPNEPRIGWSYQRSSISIGTQTPQQDTSTVAVEGVDPEGTPSGYTTSNARSAFVPTNGSTSMGGSGTDTTAPSWTISSMSRGRPG